MPTHGDYPWERDQQAARDRRSRASSRSAKPVSHDEPVWSASAMKKLGIQPDRPAKRRRPKRTWTLRRSRGPLFSGSRHAARARAVTVICLLLTAAALAQQLGVREPVRIDTPHSTLPGAYVAVQGPWHYRWVRVVDPHPGTPAYVRQRYRTVRYVTAAP